MAKADKPEKNNNKKQRHFWKDFKAELKKVIWPTRSQVINNTIIVVVIVLIVTALCFVLDLAFEALNTYGIDKLKSLVQSSSVTNTVDENTTDDDTASEDGTSNDENASENQADNNEASGDTTDIPEVTE